MRLSWPFPLFLCCWLTSCADSGSLSETYHPDVGPFDENGDYVEALADAPVKKNWFNRGKTKPARTEKIEKAEIAEKPVRTAKREVPGRTVISSRVVSQEVKIVSQPKPINQFTPEGNSPTVAARPAPKPVVTPKPRPVAKPAPKPAPKPQAVVMKPKTKAPVHHQVMASDTLFSLSRRYGVSVGSIQRANGLTGTTIVTGKTLMIPR